MAKLSSILVITKNKKSEISSTNARVKVIIAYKRLALVGETIRERGGPGRTVMCMGVFFFVLLSRARPTGLLSTPGRGWDRTWPQAATEFRVSGAFRHFASGVVALAPGTF